MLGLFDVSSAHTFPAVVTGSSGRMGSTFITGRLAPVIQAGPNLYLSLPLDGSICFYEFHGDPGLLPGGGSPWDQVRAFRARAVRRAPTVVFRTAPGQAATRSNTVP